MATVQWVVTNGFRTNLSEAAIGNLTASGAMNLALFGTSSTIGPTSTTYSALATAGGEVASGGGYTTGGATGITLTTSGTTSETLTLSANVTFTATGSGISGANTAVLYDATSGDIVAFTPLEASGSETVTAGNTLTIENTSPVLTIA